MFFSKNYHCQYPRLNSGAHRKTNSVVGVPSLVRHVAYWKATDQTRKMWMTAIDRRLFKIFYNLKFKEKKAPNADDFSANVEVRKKLILFVSTYNTDDSCSIQDEPIYIKPIDDPDYIDPDHIDPDKPEPDDYQVILYTFRWGGIKTTIRSEIYTEFFTMSIIIDASEPTSADNDETKNKLGENLDKLEYLINTDAIDTNGLSAIHKYLYEIVWDEFHKDILCPEEHVSSDGIINNHDDIGTIFADFRVLLTGSSASEKNKDEYAIYDSKEKNRKLLFRKAFSQSYGGNSAPEEPTAHFEEIDKKDNGKSVMATLWPFLTIDKSVNLCEYEFAACLMDNRRMIYATAMGPQPHDQQKNTPLFAFHYWNTNNRWQIGRMVDRLNYVGTVRLAAIMEVNKLRAYSTNTLHDIQNKIEYVRDHVSQHDDNPHDLNDFAILAEAQQQLKSDKIDAGVDQRIHRSRFYVKQFKYTIKTLGLEHGRIDGYQPYDEFIFRRLGTLFEFIDRLGIRYDQAKNDIANLSQFCLAKSSSNLAKSSLKTQKGISKQGKIITELQITGENVLLLVLVPYYASNIVVHFFAWEEYETFVWRVVTVFSIGAASIKLYDRKKTTIKKILNTALTHIRATSTGKKLIIFVTVTAVTLALLFFCLKAYQAFSFCHDPADSHPTTKENLGKPIGQMPLQILTHQAISHTVQIQT
ncbi:DUF3422 family protein [Methylovulum miyakonense]|uniref:DUF3422 family protein n=1 Tax=Methylovulum miyakonense TaxID=645578 RepID=UPI0003AACA84|nr:hypothetical protein [Methylovulum miyakonense]